MTSKITIAAALLGLVCLAVVPLGEAERCAFWYTWCGYGFKIVYSCVNKPEPGMVYCGNANCHVAVFGCHRYRPLARKCIASCCKIKTERKAREVSEENVVLSATPFAGNYTGQDLISFVDVNQDGMLDALEMKIFAIRHDLPDDNFWRFLDADRNNRLTGHMIDDLTMPAK